MMREQRVVILRGREYVIREITPEQAYGLLKWMERQQEPLNLPLLTRSVAELHQILSDCVTDRDNKQVNVPAFGFGLLKEIAEVFQEINQSFLSVMKTFMEATRQAPAPPPT